MPLRNLLTLFLAAVVCLVCYQRAARNRYVGTLAEAMNLIDEHYVDPVDNRELFEGAMIGMLDRLDPYSSYTNPKDYKRFKELGVVASMQPYHAIDDGRWAEGRIGPRRCASSYAFRSLKDAGAVLAFGSDWPVAPLDVLAGIDAAVNRRTPDGKHPDGWFSEQRITVAEAVEAYTLGSAYGGFQEKERGSIRPGKFADLAILSRDIFDPAERDMIAETKVDITVTGGNVVYERK